MDDPLPLRLLVMEGDGVCRLGMVHTLIQFLHTDVVAFGQEDGSLHHIVQFAEVAGPPVGSFGSLSVEADDVASQFLVGLSDEEVGKEKQVRAAVAQGGHVDCKLVDAVVEVLAKLTLGHSLLQVLVGRADQT